MGQGSDINLTRPSPTHRKLACIHSFPALWLDANLRSGHGLGKGAGLEKAPFTDPGPLGLLRGSFHGWWACAGVCGGCLGNLKASALPAAFRVRVWLGLPGCGVTPPSFASHDGDFGGSSRPNRALAGSRARRYHSGQRGRGGEEWVRATGSPASGRPRGTRTCGLVRCAPLSAGEAGGGRELTGLEARAAEGSWYLRAEIRELEVRNRMAGF